MVCPCTLYGVCVVCPGTSELVGQHGQVNFKLRAASAGRVNNKMLEDEVVSGEGGSDGPF